MRRILERHRVRLVHCNSTTPIKALIPGVRARRIPLVAHLHIIDPLDDRLYSALHQVTMAIGVSEAAIAGLRDDGMPTKRLRVIYNGVDPARLQGGDATPLRAELGLSEQSTVLVSLGSLIPRKGVDVLIDAMGILRRDHPDVHLLVVGDGSARLALAGQVASLGIDRNVHFLGERADVGAILRDAADIAISAARQEAFPLNLLEAAYCGRPIVASDIAPHRESIVDGETGILASTDSPLDFVAAIEWMLSNAGRAEAMGAKGAARVRDRYLLDHYIRAFEETYVDLLEPAAAHVRLGGRKCVATRLFTLGGQGGAPPPQASGWRFVSTPIFGFGNRRGDGHIPPLLTPPFHFSERATVRADPAPTGAPARPPRTPPRRVGPIVRYLLICGADLASPSHAAFAVCRAMR